MSVRWRVSGKTAQDAECCSRARGGERRHPRSAMPHLLRLLLLALTPREEVEYSLLSSDGRYLAADERRGRTLLLSPVAAGERARFTFVRAGGSSTLVHLRFGDVLLNAPAAADATDDARGAEFHLYSRPSDGKVALAEAKPII